MRKADKPPSCAVVTKSGNLNFLESSGPLQACNGTDFSFLLLQASVWTVPSRYFPFQHEHRHRTVQIMEQSSGRENDILSDTYDIQHLPLSDTLVPIPNTLTLSILILSSHLFACFPRDYFRLDFHHQNFMCTFHLRCTRNVLSSLLI